MAPESFLSVVGGDLGVIGEGEEMLPGLAEIIERQGGLPEDMKNSIQRAPLLEDLDSLTCDRTVTDQAFYHREGGCATLQTKRGCNLKCTYCTYPFIEGDKVRLREPAQVIEEMKKICKDSGATDFTIVDSIFNNPESHALSFCEAMLKKNLKVNWTAYFRPKSRDPSFFELLSRAGCSGLDATPDSLSETTLRSLGKGLDPGDVERFCRGARTAGLPVNLNFIFGAPGENARTLKETFEGIERCRPKSVIVAIGVRLYPKATITQTLVREGTVQDGDIGVDPVFYLSEEISDILVDKLREIAKNDRRWIVPGLGIRYNPRFFRRLRKHGKRGPVWKFL